MADMTRQQLDHWLQNLAARMHVEMGNSMPGDGMEAMAGEVEVIEPQIGVADRDWLHDQVRDIAEAIGAIEAAKPDDDARS
ncbi:hypothetical protein [Stenotrophomonas sp. SY1]|uniref:hypothetical protein n=1 Tax=Stenotrophomonas sp. SY1 TaxID=477235 RepID=UPI001E2BDB84|nr:hypothetical protein [Stenotrophomonas sp. SY1]MCD9087336.1 hypothetical protein [Stenotrophomonas sp. SY1]